MLRSKSYTIHELFCARTEVQWMYKCDKPDTEEYLLGRRIDKHVDDPKADDEANKGNFGFTFTPLWFNFFFFFHYI